MRNSLRNITLSVVPLKIPGIIELTNTGKGFANSGYYSKFLLLLQEYLGFSYEIITAEYSLIEELIRKNKTDLAVPFSQNFERTKIMDFSYPVWTDGIRFFVAKPKELSKMSSIIYPFLIQVWLAIFISFITSVMISTIIFWKDSKLYKRKFVKINEIAWALFGSFTNQGNELFSPSGQSCKLLVSGWILAVFVITSSYSGALMSFITFPGRECAPQTFSELINMANKGDYSIVFSRKTIIWKFIFKSTSGNGLALKKLLEPNNVEDNWINRNTIDRILKNKLAYIWYDMDTKIQVASFGLDNFVISEDQLFSLNTGFAISKKCPYKKQLNRAILHFVGAGFMDKFFNDERTKREKEYYSKVTGGTEVFHVLTVTDLAGPFLLLIFGYLLSTVVFFIEIIKYKLYLNKSPITLQST